MSSIVILGLLIRFLIPTIFPDIPYKLSTAVELSTPINSYTSLKEAFFYLSNGINAYNGGINHHPPLLVNFLYIFQQSLPEPWFTVFINISYAAMDVFISFRLVSINNWYNKYNSARRKQKLYKLTDDLIMSFYLFNPLIILTNLSHSTLIFTFLFLIESIYQLVCIKNFARSLISLAIASYLSYSPIFLIFPILALSHKLIKVDHISQIYFQGLAIFITCIGLLIFFSLILTSSTEFIDQCYGVVIRFDKIQPNIGLWWYFFTEMFDFFTPFYLGVFNIMHFIFIIPITVRLFEFNNKKNKTNETNEKEKETDINVSTTGDLFLAIFLCYVWLSFTKSYPTIGDLGLAASLVPIFAGTVFPYCKLIYIAGITWLISLLLSPIFYYCWIVLGNGNSNFFYSINLIFGGVHILVLIDFIWGKLTSDYCDIHNIPQEERSTIRLTQA